MENGPIYDASRLITRTLNATPNGIDRIDLLLADHFLSSRHAYALMFGFGGPGLFRSDSFPNPKPLLHAAWRETAPARDDLLFLRDLADFLLNRESIFGFPARRLSIDQVQRRLMGPARSLTTYASRRGNDPVRMAPRNAIYINSSHFPIEWPSHVAWFDERLDVKPVQLIHDLLPIQRPELFWASEPQRHRERLKFLARRGAAALVTSRHVEEALSCYLSRTGRRDLPIFRSPPPVAADFFKRPPVDERLAAARYFVICGTIEPRKNHQLLIDVWQRLARAFGVTTPKLVIVGKNGWKCNHILEDLRKPELLGSTAVLNGLPTSIYKRLLAHAVALLAPALAEGFGLPIGEAMALGVPVIASDIEGHREYPAKSMLLIDPRNVDSWEQAVVEAMRAHSEERTPSASPSMHTEATYIKGLTRFLGELS